ncbi:transporter, major facilitator family domain-containing protein, putative [Eimeria maxima]|uniref:Transporter, major facilitator family domain-containing protein, putative n=1 Tax=Eimeria maxima TaxID=5804 RepID=U6M373_EIMMA|nr:transporter, major facilitator family domain-containing protein, putative [Eimeria maxima]CDJ56125.1 transporter, major facilitator family domain-containing protein, putative [Eimeria maxima]
MSNNAAALDSSSSSSSNSNSSSSSSNKREDPPPGAAAAAAAAGEDEEADNANAALINESLDDLIEEEGAEQIAANDEQLARLPWLYRSVPFIVSTADLVRSMGAGMTVKFFPLFFTDYFSLSPIQLSILAVFYGLSIALFISIAAKISKYIGRALASQLVSLLGTDRGKWSAVETFTSTIWSGSAFLGGILANQHYT